MFSFVKRLRAVLASNDPAAYFGALLLVLGPITRMAESLFMSRHVKPPARGRLALIVGNSRSGTTLAYQVLTRFLPNVHPTNLHLLFPNLASIKQRREQIDPPVDFRYASFYGYTRGLHGVSEGNALLSVIRDCPEEPGQLRDAVASILRLFRSGEELPLIVKNVGLGARLGSLVDACSDVVVVRMTRDEAPLVRSVCRAYRKLGYFNPSLGESDPRAADPDLTVAATKYIRELEKHFDQALGGVSKNRFVEIDYESFCRRPSEFVSRVAKILDVEPKHLDELERLEFKPSK